jgi:hypothetical protein
LLRRFTASKKRLVARKNSSLGAHLQRPRLRQEGRLRGRMSTTNKG